LYAPTSWLWDFGDGNTSTDQNPINTFAAYGRHDISLTVTNDAGNDAEVKTEYIRVTTSRPRATSTIAPVSTALSVDLLGAIGGEEIPEPGDEAIDWVALIGATAGAYTAPLGPLAYVIIFAIPFLMMWITQRDMTLPGIVGALLGLFIIIRLPAEFHLVATTFIAISIVAVVYSLVKERA
jgi:hypothetical protein